jgi:hypothetical protein
MSPRVGLATGRAAQNQRHLAIGPGVFGEVVVDHERIAALIHELFSNRAAGVGSKILHRGGVGGRGDHDDGVIHGAVALERVHNLGDLAGALADGHVDADHVLPFLVDDCVEADGGFARLAVADDQLALATADRKHGVDGHDAGLDGRVDPFARDDAGGHALNGAHLVGVERPFAVDGYPQRVHDAPDKRVAHGHGGDQAGGAHFISGFDVVVFAHYHDADAVFLEVERQAGDAVAEFNQFTGLDGRQPVHNGNPIVDGAHGTDALRFDFGLKFFDLIEKRIGYALKFRGKGCHAPSSSRCQRSIASYRQSKRRFWAG